ncbi:MAG: metal ABC transporter permease [bacterium]|nr:metal ABC transporter permease [bacterium]
MLFELLIDPFTQYLFMKRALIACVALSLGCTGVGVILVLRRMSLMGDALSHSALPGVAIGYAVAGLSLPAMSLGGFIAGLTVALLAGATSRSTLLKEDATFVGFYLVALALGVVIISLKGTKIDLMHILLGSVLAINSASLLLVASVASFSLIVLALVYRPLILECFDSGFMHSISGRGGFYHLIFVVLVVANMVAALHAMGTLMALGLMMLPALGARFWCREIPSLLGISCLIALMSSYSGLVLSYHMGWPSGASIVLCAGAIYLLSMFFGRFGTLLKSQNG